MASRNDIPTFAEARGVESMPARAAGGLVQTARQAAGSFNTSGLADDLNRAAAMFGRAGQVENSGYQQLAGAIGQFGEQVRRDQAAERAAEEKIFLARQELEARDRLQKAAIEADNDPEKFAVAAGREKRAMMEKVPGWAVEQASLTIDGLSGHYGNQIAAKRAGIERETSVQAGLEARLRYSEMAEDAAARGNDQEAAELTARVEALNRSMLDGGMISAREAVAAQSGLADNIQLRRTKGQAERLIAAGDFEGARSMLGAMRSGNIDLIAAEAKAQGVPPVLALAIARIESDFNHKAANPGSTARGLFQHLNATWEGQGGTDADRFDPATQARLGVALIKENYAALKAGLGREPEAWELYAAHQQGGAGFLTLARNRSADMASLVEPEEATKNGGAGLTAGEFLDKWKARFGRAETEAGELVKLSIMPVHLREKAANAIEGDLRHVQAAWNAERAIIAPQIAQAAEAYSKGRAVDPAFVEPLLQRAGAIGATDLVAAVNDGKRLYVQTSEFAKLPPDAQQEQIKRASVGSAFGNDLLDAFGKIHQATITQLKTDPLGLAMEQGHINTAPLTANSGPDAWAARASDRVKAQELYGQRMPLLRNGEAEALKQTINDLPSSARASLMAQMQAGFAASGQPGLFAEALGKLADKQPEFAHAGMVALRDPEAARLMLDGADARKMQKQFDVKDDDFRRGVSASVPSEALANFDVELRAGLEAAIRSHYVGSSLKANDTSGVVDTDRLRTSINAVTGGVVSIGRGGWWGGSYQTFAAWPGQTEKEFSDLLDLVEPGDLSGAYVLDLVGNGGGALSVKTFRSGTLAALGNGRYTVKIGNQPVLDAEGAPFVFDAAAFRPRLEEATINRAAAPAPSFAVDDADLSGTGLVMFR